jgi:hypothetical protein
MNPWYRPRLQSLGLPGLCYGSLSVACRVKVAWQRAEPIASTAVPVRTNCASTPPQCTSRTVTAWSVRRNLKLAGVGPAMAMTFFRRIDRHENTVRTTYDLKAGWNENRQGTCNRIRSAYRSLCARPAPRGRCEYTDRAAGLSRPAQRGAKRRGFILRRWRFFDSENPMDRMG